MKILLIGSGGREHALAWSIAASALTEELLIAPGSDAMAGLGRCVDVGVDDLDGLMALAEAETPDLVVVGPEAPLVRAGPSRPSGSRRSCRVRATPGSGATGRFQGLRPRVCAKFGIRQPGFTVCTDLASAEAAIDAAGGACVIKADGLAAGKGVVVADDADEAKTAAGEMLAGRFGDAGATLLVEERINGPEASLFALIDGPNALFMGSAQDANAPLTETGVRIPAAWARCPRPASER